MNDYMSDIAMRQTARADSSLAAGKKKDNSTLDMTDFLQLIVAQFQNQDPQNAASSSDMLNQLVQMSVVQAITTITDATTLMCSSSLVGKEVTIGEYVDHKFVETVGTVEATGSFNGEFVIYVDGKRYALSSVMAVGRLPEKEEGGEEGEGDQTEGPQEPEEG